MLFICVPLNNGPDIDDFYAWQIASFGAHGAKGVHIGPHGTLYTDVLLDDMGLRSGHLAGGFFNPTQYLREWFRPMYPAIYASVATDRKVRHGNKISTVDDRTARDNFYLVKRVKMLTICIFAAIFLAFMNRHSLL